MAASSRFGLSLCASPRQKRSLEEAVAAAPGGPQVLAEIQQAYAGTVREAVAWSENRQALTVVLEEAVDAFDVAVAVQEALWPMRLQCAFVSAPPAGAAGSNEAIRAKCLKLLSKTDKRRSFCFEWSSKSDAELDLAAALARLHSTLTAEWTEARAGAVRSYRRHGKQAEVARELGVSQQAVSQMLLGARFRELKAAEEAMRSWLSGPQRTTLWPLRNIGTAPAGV